MTTETAPISSAIADRGLLSLLNGRSSEVGGTFFRSSRVCAFGIWGGVRELGPKSAVPMEGPYPKGHGAEVLKVPWRIVVLRKSMVDLCILLWNSPATATAQPRTQLVSKAPKKGPRP